MAASVKSGYSAASSAYSGRCGPKPKDALSKVIIFTYDIKPCNNS